MNNYIKISKQLNQELYFPCNSILKKDIANLKKEFIDIARNKYKFKEDYIKSYLNHIYRLYFSIKEIEKISTKVRYGLEMGGKSPFSEILINHFPKIKWSTTEGDLRKKWGEADESFDLIISMEVIEHITDINNEGIQDSFTKDGLYYLLSESRRVLKNNGFLFITTPNASSVLHLANVSYYSPLFFYEPHVHEYSPLEIKNILNKSKFKNINIKAIHCLTYNNNIDCSKYFKMLLVGGFSTENRGDDLFIIAQK